jgi:hypothetical protein
VEFDLLYNRLDYTLATATQTASATANVFEFPLLVKYRFLNGKLRPYVEGGPDFRTLAGVSQIAQLNDTFNAGFAFGGGVDLHAAFLHISPEIRFTRWGSQSFAQNVTSALQTNANEGQFLVGITF